MKICAACCKELPKERFSKKQWKLKPYERRCSGCIVAGRAVLTKPTKNDSVDVSTDVIDSCSAPSSNNVSNEDESSCWICLDDGADEGGNPLVRDCSCRGSLGLVHLSCLIEYAKHKTELKYDGRGTIKSHAAAMKFRKPWEYCPCCLQWYGGNILHNLAAEFAAFVEEKYADNKSYILEALLLKLEAAQERKHSPNALVTGRKILSLIKQVKNGNFIAPRWKDIELHVFSLLGSVYLNMGTRENLIVAAEWLNAYLDLSKERGINDAGNIAAVNVNLSIVNAKLGRRTNAESELENMKILYEQHVKSYGKESVSAIKTGRCYATHLMKAHKGIAAKQLLLELYETSKRVHGADNNVTKQVKTSLELMRDCVICYNEIDVNDRKGYMPVNSNLSSVNAKLGRCTNAESELENMKILYEQHVKSYGKESVSAIKTGRCYATHLMKAHKGIAAKQLLLELYETSKRVHGADNNVTKQVKTSLELMRDCVICYNEIDVNDRKGYMLAPCDHIFHRHCLEQWMDVKMECPICRCNLPSI